MIARLLLCGERCARFMILTLVFLSATHAQQAALDTTQNAMIIGTAESRVLVEEMEPTKS